MRSGQSSVVQRSAVARLARVRGRIYAASGKVDDAEAAFQHGLQQLQGLSMPFERALLELAYGQVLRRDGKRRAAALQLQACNDTFVILGAQPYLETIRARVGRVRLDFAGQAGFRRTAPDPAGTERGTTDRTGVEQPRYRVRADAQRQDSAVPPHACVLQTRGHLTGPARSDLPQRRSLGHAPRLIRDTSTRSPRITRERPRI